MTITEWLKYGYEQGYVSPPVCYLHDGIPTSADEDTQLETEDPCLTIIRIYDDADHKQAIETNHSPSQWRASNEGWAK